MRALSDSVMLDCRLWLLLQVPGSELQVLMFAHKE